ncbi:hypothetical protein CLU88_1726 [Acidovorax sp. 56]|uniref:hypothetical protein n=1 Tax=Acidovorax sp. 56 TaxID=2035205 RepID=UPI000C16961A|nr:hypothetical protein [Acidovorax sp. 56]PIF26848.1 hypothetical protein CLU88_1726 [Acidovorax sp. 56]
MLEALAMLLWCAFELALVLTGKLFVSTLSLGRWRGESLDGLEGRMHGTAGALSFKRDGQRVLTSSGLLFAGLAFYVLLGLAAAGVASLA